MVKAHTYKSTTTMKCWLKARCIPLEVTWCGHQWFWEVNGFRQRPGPKGLKRPSYAWRLTELWSRLTFLRPGWVDEWWYLIKIILFSHLCTIRKASQTIKFVRDAIRTQSGHEKGKIIHSGENNTQTEVATALIKKLVLSRAKVEPRYTILSSALSHIKFRDT